MREFFRQYGDVHDVYLPLTSESEPRGFAFVSVKEEEVDRIMEESNEKEFMGRNLAVSKPLPPGKKAPKKAGRNTGKQRISYPSMRRFCVVENFNLF